MSDFVSLSQTDRDFLLGLQRQALTYFIDNQAAGSLILDRQANHRPPALAGWCSTAATGMGLIALALTAAEPYHLLTPAAAVDRVRAALEAALNRLPHDHGILPHFLDANTDETWGHDVFSTIDSSWLVLGGLWAATCLGDPGLELLANRLYDPVDWRYWTDARGLVHQGKGRDGSFLGSCWDRLNGETIGLYVLGAGAEKERALPPESGAALRPFYGTVCGLRFNNADLGLFAFEYGLDLLDLVGWRSPGGIDLVAEARLGTQANYRVCQQAAAHFSTYRFFWGLSDGDGPADPAARFAYRAYGPGLPIDGTAHLTATLAAVVNAPDLVLEALDRANREAKLGARGRYGFSSVNLDRNWVAPDMVGIDAGAAVLALDNVLMENRVRRLFHALPCVARGLERLGFTSVREEQ